MMTALEQRLSREGAGYHTQLCNRLERAQNYCKRRLQQGANPT